MFFKKIWVVIVFIFYCSIVVAQSNIDVLHYQYKIELNDKNDTLKGMAGIVFHAPEEITYFSFDLSELNKNQKGMVVTNVNFNDPRLSIQEFRQENNKIFIRCLPIPKEDTTSVFIQYKGIPFDGLIISKNKYGQRTFFADNWPDRAHDWIPCNDDLTDKASFEFIVTAPSHYKVISNGEEVEEKILPDNKKMTHWKEDTPLSTKIMVIGVGDFAVKKYPDSPANIPVTAWVYAKDSTRGFKDFDPAPGILKFLINYIGPYPYNKLANVQSKTIFGGMENASAIFYAETAITGYHDLESTLAHEIAHQWFGDMATEKSFAHLWLSEGFATYLSHIYIESKYGTDSLNHEMQRDRDDIFDFVKDSDKPVVDSVSSYMDLLNSNSYQKGSWVLHMLRRQLGDSVFHKIIRSYYETYKGKNADSRDLQAIAGKISGKNLGKFFTEWLYTPGIPHLSISWKYSVIEKKLILTIEQTQNNDPFVFPLEILIASETGNSRVETINISKKKESFTFPVNKQPLKIVADPYTSLLFEGTVTELK